MSALKLKVHISLRILQETRLTAPKYIKCKRGRLEYNDTYACGRLTMTLAYQMVSSKN
jgi:hypothetical protein